MKKQLLVILAVLSMGFFNKACAQFHFGVKAGANLGKLNGVSYNDAFRLGYQAGVFFSYDISNVIGIQPEILFNQTNTKLSNQGSDVFGEAFKGTKRLNYLSVPVLVKFFPKSIVSVVAGPQFSILTNRNKSVVENGQQLFRESDFAAVAGVELNLNPLKIYGRYVWGFSDINDIGSRARSQQIQVGVGLRIL